MFPYWNYYRVSNFDSNKFWSSLGNGLLEMNLMLRAETRVCIKYTLKIKIKRNLQ